MAEEVDFLLGSAHRAIEAINGIVSTNDDDAQIDTNAGSLRSLATVLKGLTAAVKQCGGPDCFGRPVDGCKIWVTADRLSTEQAHVATLKDRLMTLERALRSITFAGSEPTSEFAMLCDWRAIANSQRAIATAALEGSPTTQPDAESLN
ncbi:hypothetical protein BV96_03967 [Sphingomonas paucimobilis]|nr:hypothetical protein BV96_03967 [Sphingomonas paucimobilis]